MRPFQRKNRCNHFLQGTCKGPQVGVLLGLLRRAGPHVYSREMLGNLVKGEEAPHPPQTAAGRATGCRGDITGWGKARWPAVCKRVGTPRAARWYLRGVERPWHCIRDPEMLPEKLLVAEAVLHGRGHIPHGGAGLRSAIGGSPERGMRGGTRVAKTSPARERALPVRAAGTRAALCTAAAPWRLWAGRAAPRAPGTRGTRCRRPQHRNLREEGTEPKVRCSAFFTLRWASTQG